MKNLARLSFRAYDAQLKRMFYPGDRYVDTVLLSFDAKTGEIDHVDVGQRDYDWDVNGYDWSAYKKPTPTPEVMQCTGLRDSDGKLIYEGDIVSIAHPQVRGKGSTYLVAWNDADLEFTCLGTSGDDYGPFVAKLGSRSEYDRQRIIRVIGNMHEQPKLLKP